MTKPVANGLIAVAAIIGIVVGNQYGSRNVANSRPPEVTGPTGQPSLLSTTDKNYNLRSPLAIYNSTKSTIFGSVSVLSVGSSTDLVITLGKLPSLEDAAKENSGKVSLFGRDNNKISDLANIDYKSALPLSIRLNTGSLNSGDYLVFTTSDNQVLLQTNGVE